MEDNFNERELFILRAGLFSIKRYTWEISGEEFEKIDSKLKNLIRESRN